MAIKSNTLFHFTPKEEYLFDILESGFWPRYCLEDIKWLVSKEIQHELTYSDGNILSDLIKNIIKGNISSLAYPMVCFCDIPLAQITSHTDFYGKFGIGMSKDWGIKNGLNPIFYISDESMIPDAIRKSIFDFLMIFIPKLIITENITMPAPVKLLQFIKPLKGIMKNKMGQMVEKNFDEECEWRYIPNPKNQLFSDFLFKLIFKNNKELENANNATKRNASLTFEPNDIRYIFVPEDKDIPNVIQQIHIIFENKGYTNDEIYLLSSKVISLDTIMKDI